MKNRLFSVLACLYCLGFCFAGPQAYAQRIPHDLVCGELSRGPGLAPGESGFVDRFNHPWRPGVHLIKGKNGASVQGADCGGFRVEFEDVLLDNNTGFDDPTPVNHPLLGPTTLGQIRRQTVCEVFRYIGSLIVVQGSPDIVIRESWDENNGILGAASPFFSGGGPYTSGTLYQHLTTGQDPTPAAGDYDAYIFINFYYNWNSDWNQPSGSKIDLYSVVLHEITHALGFLSLIGPEGKSQIGWAYSHYDLRLWSAAGALLIDQAAGQFQGVPQDLLSNGVTFEGERCSGGSPVYSPPFYQPGSSLSHFDKNRSGIEYVMHPSSAGGDNRVYTEPELQVLCELGYTMQGGICGNCAPRGNPDYSTTSEGTEVCVDVLQNDSDPDGGSIFIDPGSVSIESGGGSYTIVNDQLCYTPAPGFIGVARLLYKPTDGNRAGNQTTVTINVVGQPSWPVSGRKDAFIWYFGVNAGIAFGSGVPVALTNSAMSQLEGSAVQCDPITGDLRFYTNGETVWDATHQPMPNGTDIEGNWTSTQTALIVPFPGDNHRFYLFTVGAGFYVTPNNNGFRYSVIDMREHGGRGDVVEKNLPLLDSTAEKLSATRHCNGRDYWVVVHKIRSNAFYAYPVTPQGIGAPVISNVGIAYPSGNDLQGCLKFSPDARTLAVASAGPKSLELFDFDNSSGLITNPRVINNTRHNYGVEFSPDGTRLYAAPLPPPPLGTPLVQYDLQAGDLTAIRNSETILHEETDGWDGAQLQLGPDNRIYVSFFARSDLGVIADPNVKGKACNYIHDGFSLGGKSTQYGLPNFIGTDLFSVEPKFLVLDVSVTADKPTPKIGDVVSYSIQVCNNSTQDVENVSIQFPLSSGLTYLDGMAAYPVHSIPKIGAGECRTLTVRALVSDEIRTNVPITSCLSITDDFRRGECVTMDSSCTAITVEATDIYVRKEVDLRDAEVGDQLQYTVSIANQGPSRGTNILVNDVLPASLDYVSHTVVPFGTYTPSTGVISIPDLEVGQEVILTVVCRVKEGTVGDVENCAELQRLDQVDLDLSNNRACAVTFVDPCKEGRIDVRAHIGNYQSHGSGFPLTIPVELDDPLDGAGIDNLRIAVRYSSKIMVLENGSDVADMVRGTLLDNWQGTSSTSVPGTVVVDVQAPAGQYLRNTGVLLNLRFKMYMGPDPHVESDLPLEITTPGNPCVQFHITRGSARLDSICGLNFRIIELVSNSKYAIEGPLPHPAQGVTEIPFSIALDGNTRLEIVDAQGRVAAVLVDSYLQPGEYRVSWNAAEFPAGVYFCRMVSGVWTGTKPFLVVKN